MTDSRGKYTRDSFTMLRVEGVRLRVFAEVVLDVTDPFVGTIRLSRHVDQVYLYPFKDTC